MKAQYINNIRQSDFITEPIIQNRDGGNIIIIYFMK